MTVASHCRRTTCKVTKDASVLRVAKIMAEVGVGSVIVVEDERPIGIVTDRDIALRVVGSGLDAVATRVSAIMTTPPKTLRFDTKIADAARVMRETGVRRLPVVTKDGKLYGVIAMVDLVARFARQLSALARVVRTESRAGKAVSFAPEEK